MSDGRSRVTEQQVGEAVLRALADSPHGQAAISTLTRALPKYLRLSDADRAPSPTRLNEETWQEQVRNLVRHRDMKGNIISAGYCDFRPRRLRITDAGARRVAPYP
jgi:hypothetical protein